MYMPGDQGRFRISPLRFPDNPITPLKRPVVFTCPSVFVGLTISVEQSGQLPLLKVTAGRWWRILC